MPTNLLTTKLYFPPARPDRVTRPRLDERLKIGLHGSFTLISAQAGSGKTTLMSAWRHTDGGQTPAAWLSLDEGDNDPITFFSYMAAALETIQEGISGSIMGVLANAARPLPRDLLAGLINTIDNLEFDFVLVLDDYHVISSQEIHNTLVFLLDHVPPRMHLVILTRMDPPFPLARMRSRGCLAEIRTSDLRFSQEEADLYLNQTMQLRLSEKDVMILEERTEGWIAGLQMAAISLQERKEPGAFIAAFSGSHRFVMDYLASEILQQQPENVRGFLLTTSILERLSAALCDAIGGYNDSQSLLEKLEARNLFVVPLDDCRAWYRYHHLFRDLLLNHARQAWPSRLEELHLKASRWYEENGYVESALQHARAIPALSLVAEILDRQSIQLLDQGYVRLVDRWLNTLASEVIAASPVLALSMGICTYHIPPRDLVRAEDWFQIAEKALADSDFSPALRQDLKEAIATNRINLARMADQPAEVILDLIQATLNEFPGMASKRLAFLYFNQAAAHFALHEVEAASHSLETIRALGPLPENPYDRLAGTSYLVDLAARRGEFQRAEALCLEILQPIMGPISTGEESIPPACGLVEVCYGEILLHQGKWEPARHYLQSTVHRLASTAEIAAQARALTDLVRLHLAQDDPDAARKTLKKIQALDPRFAQPAELLFALSRIEAGEVQWEQIDRILAHVPFLPDADADLPGVLLREERQFYTKLIQARAQIARFKAGRVDNLQTVLAFLDRQSGFANQHGWIIRQLQLQALKALAFEVTGDPKESRQAAKDALHSADGFGGSALFRDFGRDFQVLLSKTVSASSLPGENAPLPDAISGEGVDSSTPKGKERLVELLTEREIDVLRLMTAGLSNSEISRELYLSLNTVKTHAKAIYGKLGVHNRTQAAHLGRKLGLI